jgi:hypothetical protein
VASGIRLDRVAILSTIKTGEQNSDKPLISW